jgi:hypothetical protein
LHNYTPYYNFILLFIFCQYPDVQYFVGEGRSGQTITAKNNSAIQDATRQLDEWKDAVVKASIKDYVSESGETGNTQSLEKLEVASVTRAKANTSGFKEQESWIAAGALCSALQLSKD